MALCLSLAIVAQNITVTCTFEIGGRGRGARGTTLTIVGPPNTAIRIYGGFGTDQGGQINGNNATTDAQGNYTLFIPPASTVFRAELGPAGNATHYRGIIRGEVNREWKPGRAPTPGGPALERLNGLPFDFSPSEFAPGAVGTIGVIELGNLSGDHYALTSLTVYEHVPEQFFDPSQFDSPMAIAAGSLAYADTPNAGNDESRYVSVAAANFTGPAYIAVVTHPAQPGTYDLMVGTAAVLFPDGSIGPEVPFSFAHLLPGSGGGVIPDLGRVGMSMTGSALHGAGKAGSHGVGAWDRGTTANSPHLGRDYVARLTHGVAGSLPIVAVGTLVDSRGIRVPFGTLYVDPVDLTWTMPAFDANHTSSVRLPLPAGAHLVGTEISFQGFWSDPGAEAGVGHSEALRLTLGY